MEYHAASPTEALKREQYRKLDALAVIQNQDVVRDAMKSAYAEGYQKGVKDVALEALKTLYGAAALALHEEFGFGRDRIFRALKAIDEKSVWALHHTELTDELFSKYGIKLELDEAFERVRME